MDNSTYLPIYIEESRENIQLISENLLLLEQQPENTEAINAVFRAIHTIKGMSATMGYAEISQIAHEAENYLDLVREGKAIVDSDVISALLEFADEIEDQLKALSSTGEPKALNSNRLQAFSNLCSEKNPQAGNKVNLVERYRVFLQLDENCMLKAARLLTIYNQLTRLASIETARPTGEELAKMQSADTLECTIMTKSINRIRRLLESHTEVSHYTVDPVHPEAEKEHPPPPVEQPQPPENSVVRHQSSIRVDTEKLDKLLNLVSELVINKTSIQQQAADYATLSDGVEHLHRLTADLQDTVMKMRMIPLDTVFNRFPRMVRDTARSLNKSVALEITGAETELDRTIIDDIADPLVHLIRNAIDHGVEPVEQRKKLGKSATGKLKLSAYQTGNQVVIEVSDDGAGLDLDQIKRLAIAQGIFRQGEVQDDEDIINCIFATGFSTSRQITDISGRGVGLDVVRQSIEALGGIIDVISEQNRGTVFRISLPLTLAIIQGMLVTCSDSVFVIPVSYIRETEIIYPGDIQLVGQQRVFMLRGKVLPIVSLAELMGIADNPQASEMSLVVVSHGEREVGIVVDDLLTQQEIVIKNVTWGQELFRNFLGMTILGDGSVVLILDINNLLTPLKIREGGSSGQPVRGVPARR